MQHIIIGTAGHIDHGKTTLIRALTGRETDTLREEKERGISINLGFTYFDLPSNRRAGIVDVPGHEKFVKNMLAGVGGIDLVLLVIAADEGIMPQTKEHLNIIELLDIKNGIVVITKKDMVDKEWLEMVTEDVKEELKDSILKDAPIIHVSSVTKEGIDELTQAIDDMTKKIPEKDLVTDFRIPVDRVFSVSGFGTVITGTLISGAIKEGDSCQIYPRDIKSKIRGIQIHETAVKEADAGQRVAVNIAGISVDDIARGDVISKQDSMESSMMLDCRLNYLKDASRSLKNRDRIRLYHGTSEILGRVVLLDKDEVKPGEAALIQIRLEGVIAARRGDKYVIRSYSPMITIGGGTILDPNPKRHKAHDKNVIEELILKEKGDPIEVVEQTIYKNSKIYPKKEDIIKLSGKGISDIDNILKTLVDNGKIIGISLSEGNSYIHKGFLDELKNKAGNVLSDYHKTNPLKAGMSREEFKNRVLGQGIKQKVYDEIVEILKKDTIKTSGAFVWKEDFKIKFDKRQEEIKNTIYKEFYDTKYQPPSPNEVLKSFGREEKAARMVFEALVDMGMLIKLNEDIYMEKSHVSNGKEILIDFINKNGEITAAQYRDLIGASRKYAVSLLEYFDNNKVTKRIEDKRILL